VDPDAHFGGRQKEAYKFVVRKPKLDKVDSMYTRKTQPEEIRKVSSELCCLARCCQLFCHEDTLAVRTKFYLKSFEDRRDYGIAITSQVHFPDGSRKRKFVTLQEKEVCSTAWQKIHGIPKSTFYAYASLYNCGVVNPSHGNHGVKRPRPATVQAMGSIKAIIQDTADQMPNQYRGIGHGREDNRKMLSAGSSWKQIREDANVV
jgi:hypothetical protein